jgi:tripartite-type tricarboxylate transporter receptor subunit TctC
MDFPGRRILHLAASAVALCALTVCIFSKDASSQTARTIKIVVPSTPGGVIDLVARQIAEEVGRAQGITIVVENRAGASETIGIEAVARAAPDGNTLLVAGIPLVINSQLRKVNYHPLTSFEPICHLASSPTLIVVNTDSPYRTLADLVDAARVKPGALTLTSVGPASQFHLGFEKLKRTAKVDMTFVPYAGMAPSVNALLGHHVTSLLTTYSNVAEHLKMGRLRALAVTTRMRIQPLLEVPTISESGYRDLEVDAWYATFAPAKTPDGTVAQLATWFTAALQARDFEAKLINQGLSPVGTCGATFAHYLRQQYDDYGRTIKEANFKAE